MSQTREIGRGRRLNTWLLTGMLVMPAAFCWFFLRRGYSRQLRTAAFVYTTVLFALGLTRLAEMP